MIESWRNWRAVLLLASFVAVLSACKTAPPREVTEDLDLESAVTVVVDELVRQAGPSILDRLVARQVAIDPFLDGETGQQTVTAKKAEELLLAQLSTRKSHLKVLPFRGEEVSKAEYLITGSIKRTANRGYVLTSSLTDRRVGLVIAQSAVPVQRAAVDQTPTRFFAESPSMVKDRVTEGYLKTAETPAGGNADPVYLGSVSTAAVLAEALEAYNAEQWEKALTYYTEAASRPDGAQLRVFNGIYLANVQLGRHEAAEQAFGRIVALGLATDNLAVRILFNPGSTDFWRDQRVSGAYPMWIRQIARETQAGGYCLTIVGHTSRTGAENVNARLSLARARVMRDLLLREVPALSTALRIDGKGSSQNIVGSGTDDVRDSLDRRVEFRAVSCNG
ncbi:OmpA family protein [Azoarcus olearius]|uniref:OmpA family protein n=1 Tax=Azoarcus sp. (strain BH72) TaxID=418699 RepID=UPI000323207C|nr:OmpA family protein [Azoarcus olearius]